MSTLNPSQYLSNIGFFGRPLSIYKDMIPDSFPLNPRDSLLVVPGGPSPILNGARNIGIKRLKETL